MDDDEALRLNTLNRFRKHSPRLLLEEYSHCEVPAGCGGVVLRWVDPKVGIPAMVRVVAEAKKIFMWIDGTPLESGRIDLQAGPHTLAVELEEIAGPHSSRLALLIGRGRAPAFLLSIVSALKRYKPERHETAVLLKSHPAPVWRITRKRPPEDWIAPGFDDSGWATPRKTQLADEQNNHRTQQLLSHGAVPLALPAERAWIRVRFEVPALRMEGFQ